MTTFYTSMNVALQGVLNYQELSNCDETCSANKRHDRCDLYDVLEYSAVTFIYNQRTSQDGHRWETSTTLCAPQQASITRRGLAVVVVAEGNKIRSRTVSHSTGVSREPTRRSVDQQTHPGHARSPP